jgi:hypothetical protein
MKKYAIWFSLSLLFLLSATITGRAEIKEVRMKIGGYLCGL